MHTKSKQTTNMKLYSLLSIAVIGLGLSSCGTGSDGWSSSDEDELIENCLETVAVNLPEKTAEVYCDCQLEFLKENFDGAQAVRKKIRKDPQTVQKKVQENCLDYAKEEAKKKE